MNVRFLSLILMFTVTSISSFAALDYEEYISQTSGGYGYYVVSGASRNVIGQTFATTSDCAYIDYVQLYVDSGQWSTSETLTLTLYTSTSRSTVVSRASLNGSNNGNYPKFFLKTSVSPSTTYYMELSHDGGGDNSVGWVITSSSNTYADGCVYTGNTTLTPQAGDLYFRIWGYQNDFLITAFWLPSSSYTTATQYNYIADANFNHVDICGSGINNQTYNEIILGLCASRNIMVTNSDGSNFSTMTDTQIDAAVARYKDESANAGFYVRDEPMVDNFADCARGYNRILATAPTKIPYVNLYPVGVSDTTLFGSSVEKLSQSSTGTGFFVSSTNVVGQTFITPADCTYIDYIQMYIDQNQWSTDECLTLTLYTSTARTTVVTQAGLNGSNNGMYPRFYLDTSVSASTSYYMELTHNGGGNNSVGWVVASSSNTYSSGTAYTGNTTLTAQSGDLYFKVFQNRPETVSQAVTQTSEGSGLNVTSSNRLGQTFKTPADLERMLQYIELHIDSSQWSLNEYLTLTIYDSPSRNQILGSETMGATSRGNKPRFYINANLEPDTTYFMELTHNGGGNNNVGWVCKSASDVYSDGSAYINGSATTGDFYFKAVFRNLYDDYVNEWVDAVGAENLKYLSFDHYPFATSGMVDNYFLNLEIIRATGLRNNVKTACFLQSVGIVNKLDTPTSNEMRYNLYTSLAYGMKQVQWFTYFTPSGQTETFTDAIINADGTKSSLYSPVQTLNGEVMKLGPTLVSLRSQAVYHNGDMAKGTQGVPDDFWWQPGSDNDNVIISYFKNHDGKKYIMVVNRSITSGATYTFNISPSPATVKEVSKSTGAEVSTNYTSGQLSGYYQAGEGKLYVLPTGY